MEGREYDVVQNGNGNNGNGNEKRWAALYEKLSHNGNFLYVYRGVMALAAGSLLGLLSWNLLATIATSSAVVEFRARLEEQHIMTEYRLTTIDRTMAEGRLARTIQVEAIQRDQDQTHTDVAQLKQSVQQLSERIQELTAVARNNRSK